MTLLDLLCSRNARPQKALVGRAQWKIKQVTSRMFHMQMKGPFSLRAKELVQCHVMLTLAAWVLLAGLMKVAAEF